MLCKKHLDGNKIAFKYFTEYVSNSGITPLYIILPQMNANVKYFDKDNLYKNLLVHDKELLENIMKYGIKLKVYLRKNLIANQCIMIDTLKLK